MTREATQFHHHRPDAVHTTGGVAMLVEGVELLVFPSASYLSYLVGGFERFPRPGGIYKIIRVFTAM